MKEKMTLNISHNQSPQQKSGTSAAPHRGTQVRTGAQNPTNKTFHPFRCAPPNRPDTTPPPFCAGAQPVGE